MGSSQITAALKLSRGSRRILTTAQLLAHDLSPDMAERQVRAGNWQRPARSVYVTHDQPLSGLELGHVAVAHAGGRAVISGLVAVRELGLRWVPPSGGVVALVDPELRTPSSGRVTLIRTKRLDELVTWSRDDLELAPPERAVVDASREAASLRNARGLVLGAVRDGWAGPAELAQVLQTTQHNGSGWTRRAIHDAERGCASPPEAELVDELIGCRRPFYVNPQLFLNGVLLGEPDVWFLGLGLGGEVESKERHESEIDTENTYDRHERITTPGIDLVHLSVGRIRRDVRAAARHLLVRAAARARLRVPEPSGLLVVPRGPLLH